MHALGALLDLPGGLLAAQEEDGEHGALVVREVQDVGQAVFELGGPPAEDLGDQILKKLFSAKSMNV